MIMIEKVARAILKADHRSRRDQAKAAIKAMRDIDDETLDSRYGYEYRQIIDAALKED